MLTIPQLQSLKADIIAATDAECVALESDPDNADKAFAVAALYNQTASPAFILWRSNVPTFDIRSVLVWAEYDVLSVSKQNAFAFLCSNGSVDGRLTNVRQGIQSIFTGPNQSGNLAAMVAISKRSATRAEKVFATGTGTDGSPATSPFADGFALTFQDVLSAMEQA